MSITIPSSCSSTSVMFSKRMSCTIPPRPLSNRLLDFLFNLFIFLSFYLYFFISYFSSFSSSCFFFFFLFFFFFSLICIPLSFDSHAILGTVSDAVTNRHVPHSSAHLAAN